MTKIKLDGDTLYGQVGRSPVQLHLDIGVNDAGQAYVTTNLGEFYEKNKAVTNAIIHGYENKDGKITIERYWKPEFHPDETKSLEELVTYL